MSESIGSDEIIDAEAVDGESPLHDAEAARLRLELQARCKTAGIRYEEIDDPVSGHLVAIHMPNGRETEAVPLYGTNRIRAVLDVPFERYVLLGDYSAICSYQDRTIEAGLFILAGPSSPRILLHGLAATPLDSRGSEKPLPTIMIEHSSSGGRLMLGPCTPTLEALGSGSWFRAPRLSLRIEGLPAERHDDALGLLERLADSLLFQLEVTRNQALGLMRRHRFPRRPLRRRGRAAQKDLEFPRNEYDRDPVSLYWYARGATGMPLLQFLAYYQTIEYYFPTYSQAEAHRKIRNVLKNPGFRNDRDADLALILLAAKANGQGFGDERSQLRATLNECVEPGALREFLTETPERIEYFSSKAEGLTDKRLPIRQPESDLRNDVADRIYDIRCRIVHTKSGGRDGEVELLLPFSREAELLYADIELIQFVAREVLISASTTLRI